MKSSGKTLTNLPADFLLQLERLWAIGILQGENSISLVESFEINSSADKFLLRNFNSELRTTLSKSVQT